MKTKLFQILFKELKVNDTFCSLSGWETKRPFKNENERVKGLFGDSLKRFSIGFGG